MITVGVGTARRVAAFVVSTLTFMSRPAASVSGQQRGPRAPGPAERLRSDQTRIIERESLKSEMKGTADPKRDPAAGAATLKQVGEDFTRLQILNNEVTKADADAAPLDYKRIADKSGEMHQRAVRLKNNLVLAEPAKGGDESARRAVKPPPATTDEGLRSLLLTLGGRVNSFVNNTYFKTPQAVNPRDVEAASLDLRGVVELSKAVARGAEKLKGR